jgi:MFS superfamily sulfate permease-like transporter
MGSKSNADFGFWEEWLHLLTDFEPGALLITLSGIGLIIVWESSVIQRIKPLALLPGALLAVVLASVMNLALNTIAPDWVLSDAQLVRIPNLLDPEVLQSEWKTPDISGLQKPAVYTIALSIALIASLETLLSVEAVDRLDPYRRLSDTNKELRAQGIANSFAGLLGGIPVTSVIVRSSANVYAGGQTRWSAVFHGLLLLIAVLAIPTLLNTIPLAGLASILLVVGYKLASPKVMSEMYLKGQKSFIPFGVTILAVVSTDLLTGILIGCVIGIFWVLQMNYKNAFVLEENSQKSFTLRILKDVSFMNKAELRSLLLEQIPNDCTLKVVANAGIVMDRDITETLGDFQQTAKQKGIQLEFVGFQEDIVLEGSGGH